jgi:fucose permease
MGPPYNIGYAIGSLIFITNALGFILAAPCTHALESQFGRARLYLLSQVLIGIANVTIICKPPFTVVITSFFFIGTGIAVNLALNNVFCANLASSTTALGVLHGAYGIGGTIAPLIITALASHGVR